DPARRHRQRDPRRERRRLRRRRRQLDGEAPRQGRGRGRARALRPDVRQVQADRGRAVVTDQARKIEQLLIAEVSAVDCPANELDGWMVMKARGDEAVADTLAEIGKPLAEASTTGLALPWRDSNGSNYRGTLDLGKPKQ